MNSDVKLPLLEHFKELRSRLIRCLIVFAFTTALSFVFAGKFLEILKYPAGDTSFIFTEVTEMIGIYMRVSITGGIVLSVPYITYEAIMFVSPALQRNEKRLLYIAIAWVALMFIGGVIFGYFVLLPPAIRFLISFGQDIATPQIKIGNYISVITRLLLAIGLVFELPVVTTILARIGVISHHWLANKRKMAVLLAFVAGAIITPTFDPVNQTLVAVPLIILYEMSIWLAWLVEKKVKKESLAVE